MSDWVIKSQMINPNQYNDTSLASKLKLSIQMTQMRNDSVASKDKGKDGSIVHGCGHGPIRTVFKSHHAFYLATPRTGETSQINADMSGRMVFISSRLQSTEKLVCIRTLRTTVSPEWNKALVCVCVCNKSSYVYIVQNRCRCTITLSISSYTITRWPHFQPLWDTAPS